MNLSDSAKAKLILLAVGAVMLAVAVLLGGCAHQNSGIRIYEPVTKVSKTGAIYQKTEIVASIATDMPGLKSLRYGKFYAEWSGEAMQTEEAVYDRKGNFIAKLSQRYLPGLYPSHTIRAQGEATARVVDSAAAGVTGGLLSAGAMATGAGIPGAVAGAFAP